MIKILAISIAVLVLPLMVFAGEARQITLDNGMVVLLIENHSTQMVSSIVCVRAGSKYEDATNNGFTHFLEHLLFNGTENQDRIELDEGFKNHGGYINAFTQKDLTGYLFVVPSIYSEFALRSQADQLFNSILPESEFPKERKIVIEEIKMNNDDPDNRAGEFFESLIYQGTPYARTVLGPKEIIETIPRENVLNYYRERYIPNNMIALFIGDFDSEEFIKLVDKYYGKSQSGVLPDIQKFEIDPPYSKEIQYLELPVEGTKIHCVFPAPHVSDPDYYAIDMLAQLLDSGESSPLYKALTKSDNPLINDMSFYLDSNKDFSLLHFTASLNNPENVQKIITSVSGFLANLPQWPFEKKQLERIVTKNKTEAAG